MAIRDGRFTLLLCPLILTEIRDVLSRTTVRRKFPTLTVSVVDVFLEDLFALAVMVPDPPSLFSFERDPKDEPYINLAIAMKAMMIVSPDRDLLDLGESEGFRTAFPSIAILDPVQLIQRMQAEERYDGASEGGPE